MSKKIDVENINCPGQVTRVDAAKYHAVRGPTMQVLPQGAPGMTAAEIKEAIRDKVPKDLFPGGKTLGWWQKTVQLDLEAKGLVKRADTKPLTFYKT